jgi:hypothetical protein
MKKLALLLVLACTLVAAPDSQAQLTISNTQALSFGGFVAGSGGTVTVSPNGARSASGGVFLVNSRGGAAATFNISDSDPANATNTYVITLPGDGMVTLASGSNSMTLDNFVSEPAGSSILGGLTQVLSVGATLTVNPSQPVGRYSGSFSVLVEYQ